MSNLQKKQQIRKGVSLLSADQKRNLTTKLKNLEADEAMKSQQEQAKFMSSMKSGINQRSSAIGSSPQKQQKLLIDKILRPSGLMIPGITSNIGGGSYTTTNMRLSQNFKGKIVQTPQSNDYADSSPYLAATLGGDRLKESDSKEMNSIQYLINTRKDLLDKKYTKFSQKIRSMEKRVKCIEETGRFVVKVADSCPLAIEVQRQQKINARGGQQISDQEIEQIRL